MILSGKNKTYFISHCYTWKHGIATTVGIARALLLPQLWIGFCHHKDKECSFGHYTNTGEGIHYIVGLCYLQEAKIPMERLEGVRVLWSYATYKKLKFYQIDVNYAFLNRIPFILKMFNQWPIQPEIQNYIQPSIPIQNGGRSNPNLSTNMDTHTPTKNIPLNT